MILVLWYDDFFEYSQFKIYKSNVCAYRETGKINKWIKFKNEHPTTDIAVLSSMNHKMIEGLPIDWELHVLKFCMNEND